MFRNLVDLGDTGQWGHNWVNPRPRQPTLLESDQGDSGEVQGVQQTPLSPEKEVFMSLQDLHHVPPLGAKQDHGEGSVQVPNLNTMTTPQPANISHQSTTTVVDIKNNKLELDVEWEIDVDVDLVS